LTPKIPTKGHKKRKKESEKESDKESEKEETHSESEAGEDEEKEELTDNIGLVGKVRGRVYEQELVEEDDGTRSGNCEDCGNTRVRLRKDILGVGDGNEHALPETLYIAGFRRLMTLRSSSQREGGIMGGCSPEPQCKDQLRPSETTPSSSSKTNRLLCCCGCGEDVSKSNHVCANTKRRVVAWHVAVGAEEGYGSVSICRRCEKLGAVDKVGRSH